MFTQAAYYILKISGLQCLANITRALNSSICECPNDCNSIIYDQSISQEQLNPTYSQTFNRLSKTNSFLWKLDAELKNTSDSYKYKVLKDQYSDIVASSSVVHFFFKENGIIKYSQEEVHGTMELVGKRSLPFRHSY